METNNKSSRKLLLQKQQISNADLANIHGGAENTSGEWSAAISGVGSAAIVGVSTLFVSESSTSTLVAAAGSGSASASLSEAISDTFTLGEQPGAVIGRALADRLHQRKKSQPRK